MNLYGYAELTTSVSHTGDFLWSDVLELASVNFVAGRKYLVIARSLSKTDVGTFGIKLIHGSTDFDNSIGHRGFPGTTRATWSFATVWEAIGGESLKIQHRNNVNTTHTVDSDDVSIFALDLETDLIENTDWFAQEVIAITAESSVDFSYTLANNASVTFTPPEAGDWLVIADARNRCINNNRTTKSRLVRAGEASSLTPSADLWQAFVGGFDINLLARVFAVTAVSNTFRQESSGSFGTIDVQRESSFIFAINLAKLDAAYAYTDGAVTLSDTGNFSTQLQSVSIDTSEERAIYHLGYWTFDPKHGGIQRTAKSRVQVNEADAPATQTSDAYHLWPSTINNEEHDPIVHQGLVGVAAGTHIVDLDASVNDDTPTSPGAQHRCLVALVLPPIGFIPPEPPPAPTETHLERRLLFGRQLVVSETEYEYRWESNAQDFGAQGSRDLIIEVQGRTVDGRVGAISRIRVQNPAPDMRAVEPLTTPMSEAVLIDWASYIPQDMDFDHYDVEVGVSGQAPLLTRVFRRSKDQNNVIVPTNVPIFYRVVPHDAFGPGEPTAIFPATPTG